jgi:superoxide dismutase, Fe-Mn family
MFELPPLPYDHAALEPVISRETMHLHHDKHHKKYIDTLNDLLAKAGRTPASIEEVVREAAKDSAAKPLFNNAGQAWNHTFFWSCMSPVKKAPEGALAEAITKAFGGLDKLKEAFVKEGVGHFASGWVWLAAEAGALKIVSTHDADDLLTREGLIPLLVCDLWEHAHYLDYKNDRKAFLEAWFDALPNWSFAAEQWAAAQGKGEIWRHPTPANSTGTAQAGGRFS